MNASYRINFYGSKLTGKNFLMPKHKDRNVIAIKAPGRLYGEKVQGKN